MNLKPATYRLDGEVVIQTFQGREMPIMGITEKCEICGLVMVQHGRYVGYINAPRPRIKWVKNLEGEKFFCSSRCFLQYMSCQKSFFPIYFQIFGIFHPKNWTDDKIVTCESYDDLMEELCMLELEDR